MLILTFFPSERSKMRKPLEVQCCAVWEAFILYFSVQEEKEIRGFEMNS